MVKVHATGFFTFGRGSRDGSLPTTHTEPFDLVVQVDVQEINTESDLVKVRKAVSHILWANNIGFKGKDKGITLSGTPRILKH